MAMRKSLPAASGWKEVAEFLLETLEPNVSNKAQLVRWITRLPAVSDGEILGVCLAIDLASNSLRAELIGDIIDLIDIGKSDERLQFQMAVNRHPDSGSLICSSLLVGPPLEVSDYYARILPVESFITYFVAPSMPSYLPLSPLSKKHVRRHYLGPRGGNLGAIDRWWSGKRDITWVLSSSALKSLAPKAKLRGSASMVNDVLGLGYPVGTELMMVTYPRGFDDFLRLKAPTVLDNDWEFPGSFFVSLGGANGWGLTQSCSGELPGVPERVHGAIKNPTDKYKTFALGEVSKLFVDRKKLIREAYNRVTPLLSSVSSV